MRCFVSYCSCRAQHRLSILLKLLDEASALWGQPIQLYGIEEQLQAKKEMGLAEMNAEELEKEAMAMRCFFHPNMPFRTTWDIVQVVLLLYVLIVVPLRVAFDVSVAFGGPGFWFDVCVDVYFIVDIAVNFRTAFFDTRGVIVIDNFTIAKNYLRTWFIVDAVTCLPISYIMMVIHGTDASSNGKEVRAAKIVRLLKLGKLLRVARIIRIIERYQEYV